MKILVDEMPKYKWDCPYCVEEICNGDGIFIAGYTCIYLRNVDNWHECRGVDKCPYFVGVASK